MSRLVSSLIDGFAAPDIVMLCSVAVLFATLSV